ncbi:MAG: PucR family transcriptional regulator [Anaerobacillus sp.]|uniref:PucR family transcriptional regulator n=1 Tax=Anaerobacillus sp. TaxID=1872506 RepID=UPI00391C6071
MMLEQLKLILKDALIDENDVEQHRQCLQYKTNDGVVLSLCKDTLTEEQINLLDIFLTPMQKQSVNDTEFFWQTLLTTGNMMSSYQPSPSSTYRFIHFYINGNLQDKVDFSEAIESLFQSEAILVWIAQNEGVIVEYLTNEDLDAEVESLVDTIMTDFFVKLSIFEGSIFTNLEDAKQIFDWEKSAFLLGRRVLPKLAVIRKEQLIPYLLTYEVSKMTNTMLLNSISHLLEDKELLKTIKVFFESNLNTTLASKKLFMHRNSLQYRIDKFIERTGIDIKEFQQAAAIYMLIALDETAKG